MNKRLLDGMPYTKAVDTTPEYLRAKFKKIQKELEKQKSSNIKPFPKSGLKHGGTQ